MPQTGATPIARQFIQAWNAGQRDVVDDLAAPDLTIEVDAVLAEGHQAAVHWRYQGTFQNGEMGYS